MLLLQNNKIIILIFKEIFMSTMIIKTPDGATHKNADTHKKFFSAIMRTSEVIRAISKDLDVNVTASVTNLDKQDPASPPPVVTFTFNGETAVEIARKMNVFVKQDPNLSDSHIVPLESEKTHVDKATQNRMFKMNLKKLSDITPKQFEFIVESASNFVENEHGKNEGMMAL